MEGEAKGLPEAKCLPPLGNSNLVYAIIRKRNVFHQLANLPTDPPAIHKALQRRRRAPEPLSRTGSQEGASMEGSRPAAPAEPGTLKTSLVATPGPALGRWQRVWMPACVGVGRVSGACHPSSGKGRGLSWETVEVRMVTGVGQGHWGPRGACCVGAGPQAWVWALGEAGAGLGGREMGHRVYKVVRGKRVCQGGQAHWTCCLEAPGPCPHCTRPSQALTS